MTEHDVNRIAHERTATEIGRLVLDRIYLSAQIDALKAELAKRMADDNASDTQNADR